MNKPQTYPGASEEAIKKLRQVELGIEFSRQSGKTTTIVYVIGLLCCSSPDVFFFSVSIGIFAPGTG